MLIFIDLDHVLNLGTIAIWHYIFRRRSFSRLLCRLNFWQYWNSGCITGNLVCLSFLNHAILKHLGIVKDIFYLEWLFLANCWRWLAWLRGHLFFVIMVSKNFVRWGWGKDWSFYFWGRWWLSRKRQLSLRLYNKLTPCPLFCQSLRFLCNFWRRINTPNFLSCCVFFDGPAAVRKRWLTTIGRIILADTMEVDWGSAMLVIFALL